MALVIFLVVLGPSGSAGGLDPHDPVLYLIEHPDAPTLDRWNFTTYAPESHNGDTRRATQDGDPTFQAHWVWYLLRAPKTWSVQDGTQWEFTLHIEGLDQTLPLPGDPLDPLSAPGRHEVTIEITTSENLHASGRLELDLLAVHEETQTVTVPVTFHGDHAFFPGEGPSHLRIDIAVSGRGTGTGSPLLLHYDGIEAASSLTAPGYPAQALRALDQGP